MIEKLLRRFRQAGRNALRDQKGGMGMFMAVGMAAFVGFAGVSVDVMRGYLIQSRLSSALDAAGLAGARVMFSDTRDDDIQMYFNSNFPSGYLGANVSGPNFTVDANNEVITLTAEATINTTLMQALGFDTLTVSAVSEITRQTELLDVVLAIDMSGSMGNEISAGVDRIDAARDAALELVDILYGTDGLAPLLKIGLVPWNGKVNVTMNGTGFDPALTQTVNVPNFTNPITGGSQSDVFTVNNSPVPLLSAPPAAEPYTDIDGDGKKDSWEPYTDSNGNGRWDAAWRGCVFARFTDDAFTNDADMTIGPITGVGGADWPAWEVIGPEGEPYSGSARCPMAVDNHECTRCLSHGVTPLQTTKQGIVDAIDELTSPTGTTNILGGLAWAWRVLVPTAPFTEADPNPQGQRTQAIVLLTDGEYYGGSGDAYKTAFGYGTAAQPEAEARLRSMATVIKDSGIVIYTIQFANTSGDLADLMKDVASGPDSPFYHPAPTAEELRQVFKEVANDLSQLRVSM